MMIMALKGFAKAENKLKEEFDGKIIEVSKIYPLEGIGANNQYDAVTFEIQFSVDGKYLKDYAVEVAVAYSLEDDVKISCGVYGFSYSVEVGD